MKGVDDAAAALLTLSEALHKLAEQAERDSKGPLDELASYHRGRASAYRASERQALEVLGVLLGKPEARRENA